MFFPFSASNLVTVFNRHPDRHSQKPEEEQKKAEAAFKDVNEAMGILSDPKKKEQYDMGHSYEEIGKLIYICVLSG